jgi:hypothetical protein
MKLNPISHAIAATITQGQKLKALRAGRDITVRLLVENRDCRKGRPCAHG